MSTGVFLRIKKKIFCLLLFKCTFTSFFNDKKSKRSHKTVGIKVFRIHTSDLMDPDPEGLKTCGTGGSGTRVWNMYPRMPS